MPDRRPLSFDRIDQIMPDVDRLLAGHATVGGWTLGQICDHLARSIKIGLRGRRAPATPPEPTPEQDAARRLFFRTAPIPAGRQIPVAALAPEPDADPAASAESLRGALDRLASLARPLARPPPARPPGPRRVARLPPDPLRPSPQLRPAGLSDGRRSTVTDRPPRSGQSAWR